MTESKNVHVEVFPYSEHEGKRSVRYSRNDLIPLRSHTGNMTRPTRDPAEYDLLRERSGWYAAAWRDYRMMSLQDLADELGTSRSYISDMETGAIDRNGKKKRFNSDWLDRFRIALNVAAGDLIDTNPFTQDPRFTALKSAFHMLDDTDREAVASMVAMLRKRHG